MALITRPVPGFPDYSVSICGVVIGPRKKLTASQDRRGYQRVWLYKDGKRFEKSVHRCVALAWVDGDTDLTVNHRDGDKRNNHAKNLEWISNADNMRHAFASGIRNAQKTWQTRRKLNRGIYSVSIETQNRIIDRFNRGGISRRQLAKDFGVSRTSVDNLIKNYASSRGDSLC